MWRDPNTGAEYPTFDAVNSTGTKITVPEFLKNWGGSGVNGQPMSLANLLAGNFEGFGSWIHPKTGVAYWPLWQWSGATTERPPENNQQYWNTSSLAILDVLRQMGVAGTGGEIVGNIQTTGGFVVIDPETGERERVGEDFFTFNTNPPTTTTVPPVSGGEEGVEMPCGGCGQQQTSGGTSPAPPTSGGVGGTTGPTTGNTTTPGATPTGSTPGGGAAPFPSTSTPAPGPSAPVTGSTVPGPAGTGSGGGLTSVISIGGFRIPLWVLILLLVIAYQLWKKR